MSRWAENPLFGQTGDPRIDGELDQLSHVPYPQRLQTPIILAGPWTRKGREIALQRDLRILAERFIKSSLKHRDWSPFDFKSDKEAMERGSQLSEETKKVWKVFMATEQRVGDYTRVGLEIIRDGMSRAIMMTRWGYEENRHSITMGDGAVISGIMSEKERLESDSEAQNVRWDPSNHPGLIENRFGYVAYATVQEHRTGGAYLVSRSMIRKDYGLPPQRTPEEAARGYEIGLSDRIVTIRGDELAHYTGYGEMGATILRYFPDEMIEAYIETQEEFQMPVVDLIPESREVGLILYGDKRGAFNAFMESINETNKVLLLSNRKALKKAAQEIPTLSNRQHPDLMILNPDGTFAPYEKSSVIELAT